MLAGATGTSLCCEMFVVAIVVCRRGRLDCHLPNIEMCWETRILGVNGNFYTAKLRCVLRERVCNLAKGSLSHHPSRKCKIPSIGRLHRLHQDRRHQTRSITEQTMKYEGADVSNIRSLASTELRSERRLHEVDLQRRVVI